MLYLFFLWLVSLRLSCTVISLFLQHMVVSQKEHMIFRLSRKFRIYIVVIRLFDFFDHFCPVSEPFLLSSEVIREVPTEFCRHEFLIS